MKLFRKFRLILFVLLATGHCLSAQTNDQTLRTREFVVMGYQGIRMDVAAGKGAYLQTLLELLRIPSPAEAKTIQQLKTLLNEHPNIMDFSDQVVLLGKTVEETTAAAALVPIPNGPGIYTGDALPNALEHLTRGMNITVTLKTGEQLKGNFTEYTSKRLWIRGAARKSVHLDDILALDAPDL